MKLTVVKSKNYDSWSTPATNGDNVIWISVQFKKGLAPTTDKLKIDVLDCFFSNYTKRDGTIEPKLVIMSYKPVE